MNRNETTIEEIATIIQMGHTSSQTSEETARAVVGYLEQRHRLGACPFVVQGDEGTAYCALAESTVKALHQKIETLLAPATYGMGRDKDLAEDKCVKK